MQNVETAVELATDLQAMTKEKEVCNKYFCILATCMKIFCIAQIQDNVSLSSILESIFFVINAGSDSTYQQDKIEG